MTLLQRIRYIWVRAGLAMLIAMPLMMYVTFMPWKVDESVLRSDLGMTVTDADDAIIFAPVTAQRDSALLLLPGCPVDSRAYAPLARSVASRGWRWILAGHSRGAAHAAAGTD